MISRHSSISIATAMALHVLLVMLVNSGMLEHVHKDIEPPPVIIELIQPKKLEPPPPPPKPEPKKPEPPKPPKPEPVKPEPPKVVEQRPEPPKPEPAKAEPAKAEKPKQSETRAEIPKPAETKHDLPKSDPPKQVEIQPSEETKHRGQNSSIAADKELGERANQAYNGPEAVTIRRRREQGLVKLGFLVRADGSIDPNTIEVTSGSGYQRLDEFAKEILKKSPKFSPEIRDGKAVDKYIEIPFDFKLK